MRGSVPRTHKNRKLKKRAFTENSISGNGEIAVGVKILVVKILMIIILAYSAIKIKANIPPLYSTLNPDTSSDSPSARSNGVRFVSANVVMNQQKKMGNSIKAIGICSLKWVVVKLKEKKQKRGIRRIKAILIS